MVPIHLIEHVRCAWGPLLVPITSLWPPILLRRNPPIPPTLHLSIPFQQHQSSIDWRGGTTCLPSLLQSPQLSSHPRSRLGSFTAIADIQHMYISSKYFPSTKFSLLFKYHIFPLLQIISVSQEFFSLSKTAAVPEVKYCPFILKRYCFYLKYRPLSFYIILFSSFAILITVTWFWKIWQSLEIKKLKILKKKLSDSPTDLN